MPTSVAGTWQILENYGFFGKNNMDLDIYLFLVCLLGEEVSVYNNSPPSVP